MTAAATTQLPRSSGVDNLLGVLRRFAEKHCERWRAPREGFANFLADMRERPQGMSLGRIDESGPFSPENCRWTARKAQYAARRRKGLTPR